MKSLSIVSALLLTGLATPGADWLTDGGDPQRNNWQKDEKLLSVTTAKDIKLLWKIRFDNETRAMHNLLPPLVIGSVDTASGPKQLVIQAGVSDNLYAIDVATGKLFWHQRAVPRRYDGQRNHWPWWRTGTIYNLRGQLGRPSTSTECGDRQAHH